VPVLVYALVVLVDPYDSIGISPWFDQAPIDDNRRYFNPGLARKSRFDSAVVGNSAIMLLKPQRLNELFNAAFVNLGMGAASPYEQSRLLQVFARHHPEINTVLVGIDRTWCLPYGADKFGGVGALNPFPEWLYDENPWNDFPPLNKRTLNDAGQQALYLMGRIAPASGLDGYFDFLPPLRTYSLSRARQKIYGSREPRAKPPPSRPVLVGAAERRRWPFPDLSLLESALQGTGDATRKVLLFVPYHVYHQPAPGTADAAHWEECKRRVVDFGARLSNVHVLDFMIPSEVTQRDENYWDEVHFTTEVADRLVSLIARGVAQRRGDGRIFLYSTDGQALR
jgi:hypothetical protein